jgi:hypothetical protein
LPLAGGGRVARARDLDRKRFLAMTTTISLGGVVETG